jgi:hypothetical protein
VRTLLKRLEAMFAAVAFAEEGEVEAARRTVAEADGDERAARPVEPPDADSNRRRAVRLARMP